LSRSYILVPSVLVLDRLSRPLVPLFYQIYTTTLRLKCLLCNGQQNYPYRWERSLLVASSFQEFVLGKTSMVARIMLFLNRLLLPLVLIFYSIYTNTIEMPLQWPVELPLSLERIIIGYMLECESE
jgi:hypothetical protein